jgi:hypothetical protein
VISVYDQNTLHSLDITIQFDDGNEMAMMMMMMVMMTVMMMIMIMMIIIIR